MPDDEKIERRWIVEPPLAAGEVSLYMACGDGVELTHAQGAALGELLRSLEASDAEVVGLDSSCGPRYGQGCAEYSICTLKCGKVTCGALVCSLQNAQLSGGPSLGWNIMGSFSPGIS